jgi:hypothetical protein
MGNWHQDSDLLMALGQLFRSKPSVTGHIPHRVAMNIIYYTIQQASYLDYRRLEACNNGTNKDEYENG